MRLFKVVFCLLFFSFFCFSEEARERVDLVSYSAYLLPSAEQPLQYSLLKKNYDFHAQYGLYQYVKNFKNDDKNLKKIIFFDYCEDENIFKLPKKKLICFKWEAIKIQPKFYEPYSVVYTFDDDLVDGKKFFKFYYPVLQSMISDIPIFEEKKLCTMVCGNWIPERLQMLEFFETKPLGEFEFYGTISSQYWYYHKMRKGNIGGFYSGKQKLETIKNYKFCVCFENTHTTKGYITEKIFDVFASGCIPIYWGPSNVEKYIPKNCFIDYRNFRSNEDMYQYIKNMPKSIYEQYINSIRIFLKSDQAQLFSPESFEKLIFEAVRE